MKKISEGEIQSLIRKYLILNKFRLVTKTPDGEPIHYRNELTKPPKYKVPDHTAIKSNTVLVIEDKVWYRDLFGKGVSDIDKLSSFLNNESALNEFKELLTHLNPPLMNPSIVGAFASIEPARYDVSIPSHFIYLGIMVNSVGYIVRLYHDSNVKNLFEHTSHRFIL